MFGKSKNTKDEENLKNIDTLVSSSVEIKGDIKSEKTLRLDCYVKGDITGKGIVVGETGKIFGNIVCEDIIISGRVEGNINSSGKLQITSTGEQVGDIEVDSLVIEDGGKLSGICKMKNSEENINQV
ncbi:MAG: polymer-forming cytoskeletal protein [Bacillota bacterium]|nr:polymer-forming cytoskeletal protein [Bacillota bacterium]